MVKKNSAGKPLYREDLKQSIDELTDLQREMLSLTLSGETPESFELDKIYPVSISSFAELEVKDAEEAYEILKDAASTMFDRFVMIRGGFEAETDEDIEFYRWLSQLRYSDKTFSVGLIFSSMVKQYLTDIQELLGRTQEPEAQKELELF